MWSPSAIGSRQASSTSWARWRGGNLLGTPDPGAVQQEVFQAALLITATNPPDRGPVTLPPSGDRLDWFTASDRQHDPGMLDLEPGQAATVDHRLQDGGIRISNGQEARFASPQGATSDARAEGYPQHTHWPEFVA
jgi:hypothetical protein